MIIRMRGMLQRRGISSRQFKTKGSFYHRRQLVTIRVRGNRRFPTARRRHFSNSRGGNGGKKNSSSGNNNNNKQRNQHQDQGTKRKSKPFVPTEQRVRNRDLPWIRETFDRHQRRTFLPGFDSYRQLDFVLLITLTTGVTSLCIFGDGGNDPVMQDAFSYLLSSLEDLREGHRFWLLPLMPWVCPDISSPSLTPTTFLLLGWPWFFALGATLSCRCPPRGEEEPNEKSTSHTRAPKAISPEAAISGSTCTSLARMSTGILASVYTAAGVSGCLAEAYSLQALQGRNHDGVSELSYIAKRKLDEESQRPLAGTSPAIQGLKGAAMASWIETVIVHWPLFPPTIPSVVAAASAFSFCYFHTDVLPYRRYDMIGSETDSERARLRGNQVGALTGVFLFLALRSLGRLRPPVRM